LAPLVADAIRGFRRDLNAVMSRGVWRIFAVALRQYQDTLESHALIDFSGVLERAIKLLKDLDEFAESRLRIESRYRHVLVDEFQDTSRAQWELVRSLVKGWGEGFGAADDALPPSIFIVGDRKQSIYGFRDADVGVVDEAALFVQALRPDGGARHAITQSFRSVPEILAFVNEVFAEIVAGESTAARRDAFRFGTDDRFPKTSQDLENPSNLPNPVSFIAAEGVTTTAGLLADEILRLLAGACAARADPSSGQSGRTTGTPREARPADIAILFRSRDSHRDFKTALEARGVSTYVYKGLGFFDADEIQDAVALLRYLADPLSDLRAAALLRSRIVRLSDRAVARIADDPAAIILGTTPVPVLADEDRRVLSACGVSGLVAVVGRPADAVGVARHGARRNRVCLRAPRAAAPSGAGEPEETARDGSARAEPRVCHAIPDRRPPGAARGGRRIERGHRRHRCSQPDDGARRQGP
jgi:ATP-dependent exoDNAse (exonuclease V) beta subunit